MQKVSNSPYLIPALIALPFFLLPYVTKTPPTRDQVVKPQGERVLILGASDGCGRGLSIEYAVKRGAKVCIFARTEAKLVQIKNEIKTRLQEEQNLSESEADSRVIVCAGDISRPEDLVKARDLIVKAWGGLDTLHIVSGLPSTETIYHSLGMEMVPTSESSPSKRAVRTHKFVAMDKATQNDHDETQIPSLESLLRLKDDTRRLTAVNYDGVIYSVGCFLPLMSSTSKSPLIHHMSTVAALLTAPTRMLYSSSKTGGLAAFKIFAAECARRNGGSGVRFLATCPGTIDTDFRSKSTGALETESGTQPESGESRAPGKKNLSVQDMVNAVVYHSSLPTSNSPLRLRLPIPVLGSLFKIQIPFISVPPTDIVVLPAWPYKLGWWLDSTWLSKKLHLFGRRNYGLE